MRERKEKKIKRVRKRNEQDQNYNGTNVAFFLLLRNNKTTVQVYAPY